jgi:predicted nucleic-acid-binding protein
MISVDTNVLARLLLKDDPRQYRAAVALFEQDLVFTAPQTVMLELAWVLQVNGCTRSEILTGFAALLSLPNFKPKQSDEIRQALAWYRDGLDLADALHVALSGGDGGFISFDRTLAKLAAKLGLRPSVVQPPG